MSLGTGCSCCSRWRSWRKSSRPGKTAWRSSEDRRGCSSGQWRRTLTPRTKRSEPWSSAPGKLWTKQRSPPAFLSERFLWWTTSRLLMTWNSDATGRRGVVWRLWWWWWRQWWRRRAWSVVWIRPVGKGCLWRFCCHGKTCTAQRGLSFFSRTVESYADVSHLSTSANQLLVTRVLQPTSCQSPEYFSQPVVSQPSTSANQLSDTWVLQPTGFQSTEYFSQPVVSQPGTSANQLSVTRVLQPISCQSPEYFSQSAVIHPNTSASQLSVTRTFQPVRASQ